MLLCLKEKLGYGETTSLVNESFTMKPLHNTDFSNVEQVVSAINCARRGWINVDTDIIACESCGARLFFSTPSSWNQQQGMLFFSLC